MKTMTVMQISKSQRKQTQEVEKTMMSKMWKKEEDQGELGCEDEGAEDDDDNGKADGCYESGDDDDDDDDGLHRPVCRLV